MYSKIINPETGRKVAINGKLGKTILRNYMFVLNGGSSSKGAAKAPSSELESMHPIGQERTINGSRFNGLRGVITEYNGEKIVLRLAPRKSIIIPHKYLTPITYNGKDIRLCCSNTRRGVPVEDKIPIPIIYIRAHGMTDSYVRTGVPLLKQGVAVVINSLPSITDSSYLKIRGLQSRGATDLNGTSVTAVAAKILDDPGRIAVSPLLQRG